MGTQGSSPQTTPNWSTTVNGSTGGCLAYGTIWVVNGSSVYGYDQFTGQQVHQFTGFGQGADPRLIQPFEGGLVVACDDQTVYQIDISTGENTSLAYTGNLRWMQASGGWVYVAGDSGLQGIPPTSLNINGPYGQITGQYSQGTLRGNPSVGLGCIFVPVSNPSVDAVDPTQFTRLWSCPADASVDAPTGCSGPTICYGSSNNTVYCVDTLRQSQRWQVSFQAQITGQVISDETYCYVPCANNYIYILDVVTGQQVRSVQLQETPTGTMLLDKGILYVAGNNQRVFTIAASTGVVESVDAGAWPFLIGLVDDVLYYGSRSQVAAARLSDIVKEFYAESSLIQDFAFGGDPKNPTKKPNLQTEITLMDETGAPRALQAVRIWATTPTTIQYAGAAYPIDTNTYVTVTTDSSGRVRVAVPAGDNDKSGKFQAGLTTPGLILWSTFMVQGRTILIRPDASLQSHLATISKDDLKSATGYDGQPLVNATYRNDDTALTNAAQAINATATMVKQSVAAKNQKRNMESEYCAPGCDMQVICCCDQGDYACPVVCTQNYSFSLTSGASHFRLLNQAEAAAALQAFTTSVQPRSGGWDDLWDAIKDGAAAIEGAMVWAVDGVASNVQAAITAIVDGVKQTFQLVVDTLEKAMLLVTGIFNAIADAIGRVLEALSFLFDWSRIIEVHNDIATQIKSAWTQLSSQGLLDRAQGWVDHSLEGLRQQVDDSLDSLKAQLTSTSAQDVQSTADNQQGKQNPAAGGSQNNWLQAKLQDHALSPNALNSGDGGGNQARSVADGTASSISLPDFTLPASATTVFGQLLDQLSGSISADVDATIARVRANLTFNSATEVFNAVLATLIDVVRGAVDVAIHVIEALFDFCVNLLKALLAGDWLLTVMTHPISIPFVSDLYKWATNGSDLSLLDLFALLAAIPVVLLEKLQGDQERARTVQGMPPKQAMGVASGVLQGVWGVISGILGAFTLADAAKGYVSLEDSGLKLLDKIRLGFGLTALFVVRGALLSSLILSGGTDQQILANVLLWLLPTNVMAVDAAAINLNKPSAVAGSHLNALICGVFQFGLLALAGHQGAITDPFAISFAALVGGALVIRTLAAFDEPKVKAVGVLGSALLVTSSGIIKTVGAVVG